MKKSFLDICDILPKDLIKILEFGAKIKKNPAEYYDALKHKKMILLLEKNSTRTRVSFEFAMKELGGHVCVLNSKNTQILRGESIEDTAKVFDRLSDVIVLRTHGHERLLKLDQNCEKAIVINALTDKSHPCQIIADIMTIIEQFGEIKGKKIAWIGDSNNVLQSWIEAAEKLDFKLNICVPKEIKNITIKQIEGFKNCEIFDDKFDCVKYCDVVTTDTWVSMGEDYSKTAMFKEFCVDDDVMNAAKSDAIFLHCLPAYRDFEVSSSVLDNPKYSKIVFDEAENRLHAQKSILLYCFNII